MELEKLVPKESKFRLNLADGKEFTMRPITLQDEIWLRETYGERIQQIFEEMDVQEISRIVSRLLIVEDKRFFKKQDVTIVNEEGEELTIELGGVKLLQSLVSGWSDKTTLLKALLENIGFSRPDIEEIENEDDNNTEKKSQQS